MRLVVECCRHSAPSARAAFTVRFSEEMQESFYKNQMQLIGKIDGLAGTRPWILCDFRSPKRLNPTYQMYWNRKGLISESGEKKKAFFVLKNWYD